MKTHAKIIMAAVMMAGMSGLLAQEPSIENAPPVVVRTMPMAGAQNVDPATTEIVVTFSKAMQDGSWSWSTLGQENYPETTGNPHYEADGRSCVLPVKLVPGKFYAIWLNSEKFKNFKDTQGKPAVPYLLTFVTGQGGTVKKTDAGTFNEQQQKIMEWTDRQFRGFFDNRTFEGWSAKERDELTVRMLDALKGPRNREYYQAINTLAALKAPGAREALRGIAYDRAEKDNRDRWMAIRALGLIGEPSDVPQLIPLVYHGNTNTRWWAQISLVRLTGQNFGSDWTKWGQWWNDQKGQPAYQPEIVKWWSGQAEPDKLAASLAENDQKFLESIK